MSERDAAHYREAIQSCLSRAEIVCVSRVIVLDALDSTQNVAARECDGKAGLLVFTRRQGAGRGRLGRKWADPDGKGVAMTLTVRAEGEAAARLSIAVGVAVAEAMEASLLPSISADHVRIRWPNDIVENQRGRKLAGILIESPEPGLYLVGIGFNVDQEDGDWPPELADRAVSLAQLDCSHDVTGAIEQLFRALDRAIVPGVTTESIVSRWRAFDALRGRRITVAVGERRLTGVAESIEPTSHLLLRTESGLERLPAATTSLLHIEDAAW